MLSLQSSSSPIALRRRFVTSTLLLCGALAAATAGCSGETRRDGPSAGTPSNATGEDGGTPSSPAPYTITAFDKARVTSDSKAKNFQQITADIDLHDGPFASVKLVVDLESTCFPFEGWSKDPPPPGQNWPADCDAFDRNFEFTLDDPGDAKGPPAVELVRAITPFGGPMHLDVDITDIANGLPGKHRLRTLITTWSDAAGKVSGSNGGWNVSASIEATPGAAPGKVLAVIPLLNGNQTTPDIPPPVTFEVPQGTTAARLEYRATGHGGGDAGPGCIGPAEEFCRRKQTISIDGAKIADLDPWRTDCDKLCTLTHFSGSGGNGFDYCKENPCGAVESVRAPRANWCPGSVTPPFSWEKEAPTTPGKHTFSWGIDTLASGGSWRVSAHYIAFGQ